MTDRPIYSTHTRVSRGQTGCWHHTWTAALNLYWHTRTWNIFNWQWYVFRTVYFVTMNSCHWIPTERKKTQTAINTHNTVVFLYNWRKNVFLPADHLHKWTNYCCGADVAQCFFGGKSWNDWNVAAMDSDSWCGCIWFKYNVESSIDQLVQISTLHLSAALCTTATFIVTYSIQCCSWSSKD